MHNNDDDALKHLYQRYGALVYSIAYQTLGNQEDAEEATQDVFMQVWQKRQQYDPERGSMVAWISTISRHTAIDRLRKKSRRLPDQALVSLDSAPHLWESIASEMEDDDLQRRVAAAIPRLNAEQQEAIKLAYFYGLTQREIAERLERPLGTVKSHIRQGMERLRQLCLSEES